MKRLIVILSVLLLAAGSANAQSILRNIGERAKKAVEEKVGEKVEQAVGNAVDKVTSKKDNKKGKETKEEAEEGHNHAAGEAWTCPECGKTGNTGDECDDCGAPKPGTGAAAAPARESAPAAAPAPQQKKQVESAYAKSDFVPGDEIFFEDTFENEQLGEFPSQWDLMDGYAETGSIAGRKLLAFTDEGYGEVQPLMKDQQHFLPDVFTIEFDVFIDSDDTDAGDEYLEFVLGNPDIDNWNGRVAWTTFWFRSDDGGSNLTWSVQKPNGGDDNTGEKDLYIHDPSTLLKDHDWNHFAYSFNKRALKGYVNGVRVINIPNAKVPSHFWFLHQGKHKYGGVSNVRVAKGAVPLYDRLSSDGKIITYAITFETGKADLKPESMVEINRIAKLMQDNPGISFEVQGHCDATGSDKVNDPLSQKRAEAIVAALVEQGIAAARLTPVGKGSHEPIADNSTDEGRAKNR
nr:OmpA family protein [Bacteroidales bacterium]